MQTVLTKDGYKSAHCRASGRLRHRIHVLQIAEVRARHNESLLALALARGEKAGLRKRQRDDGKWARKAQRSARKRHRRFAGPW